jgi:hypothetical protein
MSGLLFGLVAFDAALIHHLLGLQLALFFQLCDGPRLLGKEVVADLTVVLQFGLVALVRELYGALFAAIQRDHCRAFVFGGGHAPYTCQQQQQDNNCFSSHQRLLKSRADKQAREMTQVIIRIWIPQCNRDEQQKTRQRNPSGRPQGSGDLCRSALRPVVFVRSGFAAQCALLKINLLTAGRTTMGLIEFIREDLFFLAASWAFADKGFEVLMAFKSRAMLGCGHGNLL